MSAGKNAKVVPVNFWGNKVRSFLMKSAVGEWPSFKVISTSASCGPNRASIVVGHVDSAIGEPDVVDDVVDLFCRDNFADGVLDEITKTGRLLNTGACRGADVHENLTGIDGWEKVLAEERCQSKGQEHAG